MSKTSKKILAILLSVAMLVPTMPMMVFAESIADTDTATEQEEQASTNTEEQATESEGKEEAEEAPAAEVKEAGLSGASVPTARTNLYYDGTSQALLNGASGYKYSWRQSRSYSDNIPTGKEPGTYTVYYRQSNASGAGTAVSVTINKAEIFEVTLNEPTSIDWDGTEKSVTVASVKAKGGENKSKTLVVPATQSVGAIPKDFDVYSVSGNTGTNIATYTVTVTATEDHWSGLYHYEPYYTGSATAEWNIVKPSFYVVDGSDTTKYPDEGKSYTYNGSVQKPTFKVYNKQGGTLLSEGVDYEIEWEDLGSGKTSQNSVNARDDKYTATIKGKGSYAEASSKVVVWKINKAKISSDCLPTKASNLRYNTQDQALVDESKLPEGTNAYYRMSVTDIFSGEDQDAVPTAKDPLAGAFSYKIAYRIDGGQNYEDVDFLRTDSLTKIIKKNFEVYMNKAQINSVVINETVPFTYDGTDKSVTVKVYAGKTGATFEVPSDQYNLKGDKTTQKNIGTYTIKVEAKDTSLYYEDPESEVKTTWAIQKSYRFTNGALTIKGSDDKYAVEAKGYEFTGGNITPDFKVEADGTTLTKDVDYEVVAAESTTTASAINTYTIKVKGIGDYSDTSNVASATWSITKLQLKEAEIDSNSRMYDGTAFKPSVTKVKDSKGNEVASDNYTVTYETSEGVATDSPVAAGSYKVVITAKDASNYGSYVEVDYKITKSDYLKNNASTLITGKTGLKYTGKDQELVDLATELSDDKFKGITIYYKDSLIASGSETIPTGKDAYTKVVVEIQKEYPVYFRIDGGNNYEDVDYPTLLPNFTVKIDKGTPTVTITPNTGLTYDGTAKALVASATADFGTVQLNYKKKGETTWALENWVKEANFSQLAPTDAGEYEVGYKVDKDLNWDAVESKDGDETYKHTIVEIEAKELVADWATVKNLPWTGEEQDVDVTVTDPDLGPLEEDKDYTVEGETTGTNPGEYTITIKGIGNYKGEFNKTWKIVDLKAVLDKTEFDFDGKEHAVSVTVSKVDGGALVEGDDYIVLNEDSTFKATNAGTYKVKVQGLGTYADAGVIELEWTIKKAVLKDGDLSLSRTFFVWTGDEKSTTETVKHRLGDNLLKTELVKDNDYKVLEGSTFKASDAGIYYVEIEGIGNYEGTLKEEWRVQGLPIDHTLPFLDEDEYTYDGTEVTPKVTVGAGLLTEGEDYVLEGDLSATDAGEYEITVRGKGKYYGTKTLKWEIKARDLSECQSVLINKDTGLPMNAYEYVPTSLIPYNEDILIVDINLLDKTDDSELIKAIMSGDITQVLLAKLKGTKATIAVLKEGTDYTIDETSTLSKKSNEKGAYYITANGTGNYTGSVTKEWVIALQSEMVKNDSFRVVNDKTTYSGEEVKPQLQVKDTLLSEWKDIDLTKYQVTDDNGVALQDIKQVDAGTYTLHIEGIPESGKYGSQDIEWTIEKKKVVGRWDKTETIYNGEVQRPVLTLDGIVPKDQGKVTVNETKAISLLKPQHAGTYYMYCQIEFADDFNKNNYEFEIEGEATKSELDKLIDSVLGASSIEDYIRDKIDELIGLITDDKYVFTKFVINKRQIGVEWSNTEFTYDGIKHAPTAEPTKATPGSTTGLIDGDYCRLTVEGAEKNAGNYSANVSGLSFITGLIGDYEIAPDQKICPFTINPKNIGDATVVGIQKLLENLVYNAEVQKPTLSVTDLAITALDRLYEDTDYVIDEGNKSSTSSAIDAGDYKIIIKGIGNYTGTRSIDWEIGRRNILDSDVEIELSSNQLVYKATSQGPTVSFKYKGVEQAKSQYSVSGTTEAIDVYDVLSIGITDYTMYITGNDNFWGVVQRDWEIVPLNLATAGKAGQLTVTLEPKTYNGKSQMPEASKVVYTEAGVDYEIPLDEMRFTPDSAAVEAGDHPSALVGQVKINKYATYNVIDGYFMYWTIQPKKATEDKFDIDMGTYTYNGKDQKADPTIVDKETGKTLVEGTDYDLVAIEGTDQQVEANGSGTYELTIKFKGNYTDSFTENWTIQQKDVTVTALDAEKFFDPFEAKDPEFKYETEGTVEGYEIDEDNVSFSRELEGTPEGEELGKYKITMEVQVDEYPNYNITVVNEAYLTIKPNEYEVIEGTGQKITYGTDTALTFRVNGEYKFFEGVKVDGKEIFEPGDYTSWSGSTFVKLEPAFVKSLAVGEHTIEFMFMDGSCSTTITVVAVADTGDANDVLPYALLLMVSVIALAGYGLKKRENR